MDTIQNSLTELNWIMAILLFATAFLYSSVGHGGASGYLAIMALMGISPWLMKPSALLLNIFVSGIAFYQFYRAGYFRWKLFLPFAITSVPAAYFGGNLTVGPEVYRKTLGASIAVPAVWNFLRIQSSNGFSPSTGKTVFSLFAGLGIGLLSGTIGIGGGIILSPLILILNWANMKETACASALFIFVNSISGFWGLVSAGQLPTVEIVPWIIAALAGGLFGAHFGSFVLDSKKLGVVLSIVLMIASIKLFFF